MTSYLIAIKGIGCAVKLKTEYGISQQRNYEWMQSFKTEFEISLREYSKETQNRLEELSDVQNRLMQDNNLLCNRMDRSIEAMCSNNSESLIKINTAVNSLKKTVEENTENSSHLFQSAIGELHKSISETDRRHGNILKLGNIQNTQYLNSMKTLLENNVSDMQNNIQNSLHDLQAMINKSHSQSELHIQSLADIFGNQTENALNNNIEQMNLLRDALLEQSNAVAASLTEITNQNAERLMSAFDSTVSHSAEVLADENESFHEVQEELLSRYLQNLSETYNKCTNDNIIALEKQVEESIAHFTEENREVTQKHNDLTNKLLTQEISFVNELETNNSALRQTITSAFDNYSNAASANITRINDIFVENITESSKNNAAQLQMFSEKQRETISQFDQKLSHYSDSLVERSAQAVGMVQKDNNIKLQELSDSLTRFATENVKFKDHCDSVNGKTNENITRLISHYEELKKDLSALSEKSAVNFGNEMNVCIVDMIDKLRTLNAANADEFRNSMDNYRENFVAANSVALASVQKDNVDAVTDANKKVSQLSEMMSDAMEWFESVITRFQTDILENNEKRNDFMNDVRQIYDDKLQEYVETSREIQNSSDEVKNSINGFISQCDVYIKSNTNSYKNTLDQIFKSQRDANSLTEEDIKLLKQLLKR